MRPKIAMRGFERVSEYGVAEPERLGVTPLADGRRLAWGEWGPENGSPVVLCPGAGTGRSLGFATADLDALGVRLVSADRPGLGGSTPLANRNLNDWPSDVRELARERGLEGPAMVGFSQGAPFALACAAAGVATRVAVVSGTDELAHPAFAEALDPQLRGLIDAVAADQASAEAELASMDADRMWELVIAGSSEVDRGAYTQPAFAAAFRRALAEGFEQGADGYARDTVLTMSPWPFEVEAIEAPVDLWYGAHDASPVHSPDLGETLERRIPTVRRHLEFDAGGALLWTQGPEILSALLDAESRRARP
jgi:pimeloyl-ACP methyl ester carboxylesterase